ncbi:MAG TPA: hypothetical protein VIM56_10495 [Rhizomicrobium sp.]
MDGFLILGGIVLFVGWIIKSITAPVRSAATLKRIEEELKSRR